MDVRRDKAGNVLKPKRNGGRKKPKVLGTIEASELVLIQRTLRLIDDHRTQLSALEKYYHQITVELAQKYEFPGQYSVNWNTGQVTELETES